MGTIVPETQGWVRDLEAVVGRIRAVAAARVVVDANDNIETIHVLAGRTRTAEQILADIQSVGAALFDLDIDPGRVRISQPEDWPGGGAGRHFHDGDPPGEADGAARAEAVLGGVSHDNPRLRPLSLHGLTVESTGGMCRVFVKLRTGDELYEGQARGVDMPGLRPRLCAEAALHAFAQFQEEGLQLDDGGARPDVSLTLSDLHYLPIGPGGAVVVSVVGLPRHMAEDAGHGLAPPVVTGAGLGQRVYLDHLHAMPGHAVLRRPEDPGAAAGMTWAPPGTSPGGPAGPWLLGVASVDKDLCEAAARAVLAAVHGPLLSGQAGIPSC